jgi:hypothetical protein
MRRPIKRGRNSNNSQGSVRISAILRGCGGEEDEHRAGEDDAGRSSARLSALASSTTRENLRIRFRERCWLCGLLGTDTCHVYPKDDEALVSGDDQDWLQPLD